LKILKTLAIGLSTVVALTACGGTAPKDDTAESKEVNIYTSRHYDVDKEIYKKFEEKTGIKVNVIEGKTNELVERLSREGEDTTADLFLSVGAENIYTLTEKNLLETLENDTLKSNIAEDYRGDNWVGLTGRARLFAYDKTRGEKPNITKYEDITKDEFKGKVLVRSSSSSYNNALLSSLIQTKSKEYAEQWAQGVKNNMARTPEGNDRAQAKAVAAGVGDIAIMNSYYLVRMLNSSDAQEAEVGKKIGLIFPEDTHINLSWGGVVKGSKNKDNAHKLLEYLTGEEVQKMFTEENGEYPLNKTVEPNKVLRDFGAFTPQQTNYGELGKYSQEATIIFDKVGWK